MYVGGSSCWIALLLGGIVHLCKHFSSPIVAPTVSRTMKVVAYHLIQRLANSIMPQQYQILATDWRCHCHLKFSQKRQADLHMCTVPTCANANAMYASARGRLHARPKRHESQLTRSRGCPLAAANDLWRICIITKILCGTH